MEFSKLSLSNLPFLSLLLVGVLYVFLSSPSLDLPSSFRANKECPNSSLSVPLNELESSLEKASTVNKTVILAVINKAYVEQTLESETTMFDLFLESFWLGQNTRRLLDHLLIVAVDETAYERCRFKRLNCYRLITDGVDFGGEKIYMSADFIKMMWTRTLFLLDVLTRGYNFIFTDTDIMWLRDPFLSLSKNESIDIQFSVDIRNTKLINTGFYFIRSNNKTISLFDKWYSSKDNSTGMKEQDVLSQLLKSGTFQRLGLQIKLLDTVNFSGFCQNSKDFNAVNTVHANCCRYVSAKVNDLKVVLRDWKKYKDAAVGTGNSMTSNGTTTMASRRKMRRFQWSPHVACWKSWNDSSFNPLN